MVQRHCNIHLHLHNPDHHHLNLNNIFEYCATFEDKKLFNSPICMTKWLYSKGIDEKNIEKIFVDSCKYDHDFIIAQWLYKKNIINDKLINYIFIDCCKYTRLYNTIKWLYSSGKIKKKVFDETKEGYKHYITKKWLNLLK